MFGAKYLPVCESRIIGTFLSKKEGYTNCFRLMPTCQVPRDFFETWSAITLGPLFGIQLLLFIYASIRCSEVPNGLSFHKYI